jgi:hypothetical protein
MVFRERPEASPRAYAGRQPHGAIILAREVAAGILDFASEKG